MVDNPSDDEFAFLVEKAFIIMMLSKLDCVMIWIKGLNNDLPGLFSTSRSAADLGQQLKRSFARAEIRQIQGSVSIQYANKCYVRKIQSFAIICVPNKISAS